MLTLTGQNVSICLDVKCNIAKQQQTNSANEMGMMALSTCGPMVQWLACLIFTAAIGVQIPVLAVKFHVYDYNIERHPRQVSENYKPCEGNWVVRWVPEL